MTEYNSSPASGCMGWDDVIEDDGQEFITLPEGDYAFQVIDFERGRFPGGRKIPPCNMASLTLEVRTPEGTAHIRTDLILYHSLEWKISSFFRSIGEKEKGKRLAMNWDRVINARGRAHFKPRTYVGSDGQEHTVNNVDRFYDYDAEKMKAIEKQAIMNGDEDLPFD